MKLDWDGNGRSFSYGEGGGSNVGSEFPLHGAAALELVAWSDDPKSRGVGVAAADPSVDDVVLVVQRVLILVIHLKKIQRVAGPWICLCLKF